MIDVCLILEGTYPYVSGGVSTWVHQLVSAMKNIRFGIVYISPHSDPTRTMKYEMPANILSIQNCYLHDYNLDNTRKRRENKRDLELVREFYADIFKGKYDHLPEFIDLFRGDEACYDIPSFFSSKGIWKLLMEFYDRYAADVSLVDFFWTWRGLHLPLIQTLQTPLPRARVYHSISTGYAGLLGAVARLENGGRYFLTEHGIYTHERMLEISQANWIYEKIHTRFRASRELSFFKQWWISLFQALSSITYKYTDKIFTLYEGNSIRQMLEGADSEKITIIPNGIDLKQLGHLERRKKPNPQICLIGRVVNIKDIKTYIHAAKLVLAKIPEAQFFILGPTDEEEDYYDECKTLIQSIGVENNLFFTGRVDLREYLTFMDMVVLTSLSEAQPYVILEANIAGIPVVSTNVGSCAEMLNGRGKIDRLLGPSGLITQVSHPEDTARAILELLGNETLYRQCSAAGRERVKRYYDQDDLLSRYLNFYEQVI